MLRTSRRSLAVAAPSCDCDGMAQGASAKQYIYRRRQPEETLLYQTLAANVETFIAYREAEGRPVPEHVAKELRDYLKC